MAGPGQPAWEPSEHQLGIVRQASAAGSTWRQIARLAGVREPTIKNHPAAQHAFDEGRAKAHLAIGGQIYRLALGLDDQGEKVASPDKTMLIFYAKTQMGWRETNRFEHSGPGGAPLDPAALNVLSDAELTEFERIMEKLALASGGAESSEGGEAAPGDAG